jgi:hypothetical protein
MGGGEATMRVRWETSIRYYEVRLMRDLLQDWVLVVSRGGKAIVLVRSGLSSYQAKRKA